MRLPRSSQWSVALLTLGAHVVIAAFLSWQDDDSISLRAAFLRFRDLVSSGMGWSDLPKARFRMRAT